MSLHYVLVVMKDGLDFSFNILSTTLEVTLASGFLHLSIEKKCQFLLAPRCISKQSEENASAWYGSGAFHTILASLPCMDNIEKNTHIQNPKLHKHNRCIANNQGVDQGINIIAYLPTNNLLIESACLDIFLHMPSTTTTFVVLNMQWL
jgi:hypothetical protein